MKFLPTELAGAFVVELEPHADERGFFARTWCADEFAAHGLATTFVQGNVSFNHQAGTMRGMHWQAEPHAEDKLVRVTAGAVWDVVVDLRPGSPTYLRHVGVRLDAANRTALFVPKGFAHGFLTLEDATEVVYQMSAFYAPEAARGARWDDPAFAIDWPAEVRVISDRDATYPDYRPAG
jgi:dTDP-4-dehydrorhamnose 3,5-epimerase